MPFAPNLSDSVVPRKRGVDFTPIEQANKRGPGSGNELYTLHEIEVKPPLGDDAEKGERRRARTSENAELFALQIGESLER